MSKVQIVTPKAYGELDNPHRYKVMWGGRGSGKSHTVARKLLARAATTPGIRILCTRELQKSIKQSVHKLLSNLITELGMESLFTVQAQGIYGKNGSEFLFFGLGDTEQVKSTEDISICWIEEGHSLSERSWDIIDPTIRADGSEIWVTYNTRFKFDHLHQMFVINKPPPDAWVRCINHDENQFFPEVLRKQMEHMRETDYEKYLHIWQGELKVLAEGAIFGRQVLKAKKDGRLCRIPVISNCEVSVFFDLGKSDQTALFFMQRVGREYRFIDYYQNRLEDVEHYVKFLKAQDYNYGTFYMPHDADHDRLGMHHNIREQFEMAGIKPVRIVPRTDSKENAIAQGRQIFAECWFHNGQDARGARMEKGWEALCNYRYQYSDDNDVFAKKPHHDWASNGADAFLQFAQDYLDASAVQGMGQSIPMNNDFSVF